MSFSPETFHKKLAVLQDTQESIVSLSQWVLFHHRHSKATANVWSQSLLSAPGMSLQMRLSLLHLCNDVVQRARRKNQPELIADFAAVLPLVLKSVYASVDEATRPKIDRLLAVWDERAVFSPQEISKMKEAIASSRPSKQPALPDTPMVAIAPELVQVNALLIKAAQLGKSSAANLTQLNVQAKTYLPEDVTSTDSLPAPKVYLGKLNMLENFSQVSISNVCELIGIKKQVADQLSSLARTISDGIQVENDTVNSIKQRLARLESTRAELREMLDEKNEPPQLLANILDVTPPVTHESDDDCLPTYDDDENENSSDNENSDEDRRSGKKEGSRSRNADGEELLSIISRKRPSSLLQSLAKRVAFSEDIQVKEFDVEGELSQEEFPQGYTSDPSSLTDNITVTDSARDTPDEHADGASTDIMDLLSKLT